MQTYKRLRVPLAAKSPPKPSGMVLSYEILVEIYTAMDQAAAQPVKRVELTDDEIGVVWGDTAMADIAVAKNHADGVCEFAQAIIAAYNAKNGITSEANGQIK